MACLGATGSICTGLTTDETCAIPKTYNVALPSLVDLLLSYDGVDFSVTWDTTTSYPTHVVKIYLRPSTTPYFTDAGIVRVSRDSGTLSVPATSGVKYRLIVRVESATEFNGTVTTEVMAEILTDFPLGKELIFLGTEEVFYGTEYVYA